MPDYATQVQLARRRREASRDPSSSLCFYSLYLSLSFSCRDPERYAGSRRGHRARYRVPGAPTCFDLLLAMNPRTRRGAPALRGLYSEPRLGMFGHLGALGADREGRRRAETRDRHSRGYYFSECRAHAYTPRGRLVRIRANRSALPRLSLEPNVYGRGPGSVARWHDWPVQATRNG